MPMNSNKRAQYFIAWLLCLVKRGNFFEMPDRKLCFSPRFSSAAKVFSHENVLFS